MPQEIKEASSKTWCEKGGQKMEQLKEYYPFIIYKREDIKETKHLQNALEYYRLPNRLRQENPELPEYVRPIFHDMN